MTVSIIIAVKTYGTHLEECAGKCQELDFSNFEIIVLPDQEWAVAISAGIHPVKIIPTGPLSPAEKRDIGITHAQGEILAFIDDDAYPRKDWLRNAMKNFAHPQVAAVGGPALTPPEDSLRQKASGLVYASALATGKYVYRYLPQETREVDDYPSCNFLVRKSVLQELGGFNTRFWPGEDTKLCLDITKKLGKKIIYDPEVVVYHHRRGLFMPHLKQVASYAIHRGYFVKKYPQTSFRISYFIPSLFLLFLLAVGILACFLRSLGPIYFFILFFYLFLVIISSIKKEFKLIPFIFVGIILTHLTYGLYFLRGLLSKKLKEESNFTL